MRITAYRRRRGWHAWHTAVWQRFTFEDFESGIPPLHMAMGIPAPPKPIQSFDEVSRTMQTWVAATRGRLH